jgi:hypothetical protein
MANNTDERGLVVFLADWIRSQPFRDWLLDPLRPYADVIERLRADYLLDDSEVGIVSRRERGPLVGRIVQILFDANLDFPDPWAGAQSPAGDGSATVPVADAPARAKARATAAVTAALAATAATEPVVGWGAAAISCLESVRLGGEDAVVKVGQQVQLELAGWNLSSPIRLKLSLDGTDQILPLENVAVTTDAAGRSGATISVTLPAAGNWTVTLMDQGDARSSLPSAIEAQP